MELEDKETVKSWKIGKQLTYTLLIEAHHPGHNDGIPTFQQLIKELFKHITDNNDDDCITIKDTEKMFDIIIKENKPKLLDLILNNPLIPESTYDGSIAKTALKQAIRVGSLDVVNFMIDKNVTVLSNDMNNFDDIKSIIFNILRSVEIDQNYKNTIIANTFWNYLAKCFYQTYHKKNDTENKDEPGSVSIDDESGEKKEAKWDDDIINNYDNNLDEIKLKRHNKFFVSHPLIQYAIYKKVYVSSSGKHYINKLIPILHFICEHFMKFEDEYDLNQLYDECVSNKLFDCQNLIKFNIIQDNEEKVKLFWSEYVTMKLINDYLGLNQLNKYKKIKEEERNKMLNGIKYLISNGVGKNLENIILPKVKSYSNNKSYNNLMDAIKYGENIWIIKKLKEEEISSLFENVCNKTIDLPHSLCSFILSFVVL